MKGQQNSLTIGKIFANGNRTCERYVNRLALYQLRYEGSECMSSFVPRAAYRKQTVHDPLQNGSSRQLSITLYNHQSPLTATAELYSANNERI